MGFGFTSPMKSLARWGRPGVGVLLLLSTLSAGAAPEAVRLWPDQAPGVTNSAAREHDMSEPGKGLVAGRAVIRLTDITEPSVSIYRPPADKNTGAAVVICPGGGYHILAWDLEGTEVCEWLNSIGVTGVLLKYRVPKHEQGPLQDAQRALGLVRHRAKEWGVDPQRIGVLGFSAGGHLAAELAANNAKRVYEGVDGADAASCRPDFQVLIYPAYLVEKEQLTSVASSVLVTSNTPPAFVLMAEDDPVKVENVLTYALALKQAKVPLELHIYPTGGHGYGLRPTKEPITKWPELVAAWMKNRGLLERR